QGRQRKLPLWRREERHAAIYGNLPCRPRVDGERPGRVRQWNDQERCSRRRWRNGAIWPTGERTWRRSDEYAEVRGGLCQRQWDVRREPDGTAVRFPFGPDRRCENR